MKQFLNVLILSSLSIWWSGCGTSSDDTPAEPKKEIVNTKVPDRDVNSPDYWDDAELVWSDDFEGSSILDDNWLLRETPGAEGEGGFQNFTADGNVEVSNGNLKIIARKVGDGQNVGDYTSAQLNSKFAYSQGRMEIRAKLPESNGNGLWARLWMLGNNLETVGYPQCGELIFMKYFSHKPNEIIATAHTATNFRTAGETLTSGPVSVETAEREFHNYGVLWTKEYLKFYLDEIDNIIFTYPRPADANADNWPFDGSFFFGMDLVVGGDFGGAEGIDDSIFPVAMEIDHVRVYYAR